MSSSKGFSGKCFCCKGDHMRRDCEVFKAMSPEEKAKSTASGKAAGNGNGNGRKGGRGGKNGGNGKGSKGGKGGGPNKSIQQLNADNIQSMQKALAMLAGGGTTDGASQAQGPSWGAAYPDEDVAGN